MKTWRQKYEWIQYALCEGSDLHTGENLTDEQINEAASICFACLVRPECMEWAVEEKVSSVIVAGQLLPDPMFKRELRAMYANFRKQIPDEKQARGDV